MNIDEEPMDMPIIEPESSHVPNDEEGSVAVVEKPKSPLLSRKKKQLSEAKLEQLRKAREAKRKKRDSLKQQKNKETSETSSPPSSLPLPAVHTEAAPHVEHEATPVSKSKNPRAKSKPKGKIPLPPLAEQSSESESDYSSSEEDDGTFESSSEEDQYEEVRRYRKPRQRSYAAPPAPAPRQWSQRDAYLSHLHSQMFG